MISVGIIAGDQFDSFMLQDCVKILDDFDVGHSVKAITSLMSIEEIFEWVIQFEDEGGRVIIVGTNEISDFVDVLAKRQTLTVIKVPLILRNSIERYAVEKIYNFFPGSPIATVAINNVKNAALLAVAILSIHNTSLRQKLKTFRNRMLEEVQTKNQLLQQTRQ